MDAAFPSALLTEARRMAPRQLLLRIPPVPMETSLPWIDGRMRDPDRLSLFCFPPAGAGASTFATWRRGAPAWIEVLPVELPGRGRRQAEPAVTTVEALMEAAVPALAPFLSRGQWATFGHSLGALVATELVREAVRQNLPSPVALVASGQVAPHLVQVRTPTHDLPDEEFLAHVRMVGAVEVEALEHPELRDLLLPQLRADFAMATSYRSGPPEPLACALVALAGEEDHRVDQAGLEAWRAWTSGPFRVRRPPGGHLNVRTHSKLLLQTVVEALDGAHRSGPGGT